MGSKKFSIKEGFLEKRSTFMKIPVWRQRYFVLNSEVLCYFKKEEQSQRGMTPIGRIFLLDIKLSVMIECQYKRRKYCLTIEDDESTFWLSFESEFARKDWALAIKTAKENDRKKEETDPIRKRSMKLKGGLKRVTINRSTDKGVGCTIKNIGGIILVNRILEDGPVAGTGILRPGDQLMEVNGVAVTNKSIQEISGIIKSGPENTIFTVKPVTDFRFCETAEGATRSTPYAELDHGAMNYIVDKKTSHSQDDLSYKSSYSRSLSVPTQDIAKRQCVTPPAPRKQLNYVELDYSNIKGRNMLLDIADYQRSNSLPTNSLLRPDAKPTLNYIDIDMAALRGRNQSDASSIARLKRSPLAERKGDYANLLPTGYKPIPAPRTGIRGARFQKQQEQNLTEEHRKHSDYAEIDFTQKQ